LAATPVSEQSGETGGWEAVWQKNKVKILIFERKLLIIVQNALFIEQYFYFLLILLCIFHSLKQEIAEKSLRYLSTLFILLNTDDADFTDMRRFKRG